MTDRLSLYNGALRACGERELASLTEARKPRRLLDAVWNDGIVRWCLEQGFWNFATRTVELEAAPSVEPDFGYRYAFDKPDDWVRTSAFCADAQFRVPVTAYADEAAFWFCDLPVVYVQYISDDDLYGLNMAAWPETFVKTVQLALANEVVTPLTHNEGRAERIGRDLKKSLVDARSKDAMNQPTAFRPAGTFVRARLRGTASYENPPVR